MTKQELINSISDSIYSNGSGSITGDLLKDKLLEIINNCYNTNLSSSTPTFSIEADDNLSIDDIGKLVVNINDKATLLPTLNATESQKGKWLITGTNLPDRFTKTDLNVDFTGVSNSDFTDGSTRISYGDFYIQYSTTYYTPFTSDSNLVRYFILGSDISETINNIQICLQNTVNIYYYSYYYPVVSRNGNIITLSSFKDNNNAPQFDGFNPNTPSGSVVPGSTGFLEKNLLFNYYDSYNDTQKLREINVELSPNILNSNINGGNYTSQREYILPDDIPSYILQLKYYFINYINDIFEVIDNDSTSFFIQEKEIPTGHNYIVNKSETISIEEIIQSQTYYPGEIYGLFLGELIDIVDGQALINASDVFYVISNNYINTGSILTAVNGGLVDVFIGDDKDIRDNLLYTVPTFKALSSGTTVPVRLIHNFFYLEQTNSNSSSSSSYYSDPRVVDQNPYHVVSYLINGTTSISFARKGDTRTFDFDSNVGGILLKTFGNYGINVDSNNQNVLTITDNLTITTYTQINFYTNDIDLYFTTQDESGYFELQKEMFD